MVLVVHNLLNDTWTPFTSCTGTHESDESSDSEQSLHNKAYQQTRVRRHQRHAYALLSLNYPLWQH